MMNLTLYNLLFLSLIIDWQAWPKVKQREANSNRMSHFKVCFNQVQILGASGTLGTYSSASSEFDYDESSANHEIDVWKK